MILDPFHFLEKRIQALSLDAYELYVVESRHFSTESKDGQVESLEEAREKGVAVRLFKDGKVGFGCSSDWTEAYLQKMLDQSFQSLSLVEEGNRFELPRASLAGKAGVEGLNRDNFSAQQKLEMALALERGAKGYDRRISRVRGAQYSEEEKTVTLKNSKGLELQYASRICEVSLMAIADAGDGSQEMAWESDFAVSPKNLNPEATGRRAAEKAVSQLGAKPIETQKAPAVLDAMVVASFLGVLSSSFFGDQVQKSRSALRDRLGALVYSPLLNLVDQAQKPGAYLDLPFDGEGTLTRRNVLVDKGILKQFLYDIPSGIKAGRASTGNARRGHFKETPYVGPTNFFLESAEPESSCSLEALLQSLGTGFWVRDVIGVHTADAVTGDFSLGASGLWVEGGHVKKPVRGVAISGNLHEMLRKVSRVGDEPRFYHAFGAPPLLIEELDIGGL